MFAFVHIPKTAGSTVSTILRQSFRSQHCDVRLGTSFDLPPLSPDVLRRTRWIYRQLRSIAGHGVVPHGEILLAYPDMRFYTFLRDPIIRCASEYQYLVQRNSLTVPFERWIETDAARNRMTRMLCGQENADAAIDILQGRIGFVGLSERFNESLILLRHWFQDQPLDIRYRSKNVTSDNRLKKQLLASQVTRDRLSDANGEDIRLYRHAREELFAQQVQSYGPKLAEDVSRFESGNRRPWPYPRQLGSLLLREMVYKPLAPRFARAAFSGAEPNPDRMPSPGQKCGRPI